MCSVKVEPAPLFRRAPSRARTPIHRSGFPIALGKDRRVPVVPCEIVRFDRDRVCDGADFPKFLAAAGLSKKLASVPNGARPIRQAVSEEYGAQQSHQLLSWIQIAIPIRQACRPTPVGSGGAIRGIAKSFRPATRASALVPKE